MLPLHGLRRFFGTKMLTACPGILGGGVLMGASAIMFVIAVPIRIAFALLSMHLSPNDDSMLN